MLNSEILSPETCRVKPLRRINAIVASCWIYFTTRMQVFIYCKITLHVLVVYRAYHQDYIKL